MRRDPRNVIAADGEHDAACAQLAVARGDGEAIAVLRDRVHRDALVKRRLETLGIALDVVDDRVLEHEAVGIVTVVGVARQPALPIRGHEAERVPALRAPRRRDAVALEHDVVDAAPGQLPARGKAGLAAADDDDAVMPLEPTWRRESAWRADGAHAVDRDDRVPAQRRGCVLELGDQLGRRRAAEATERAQALVAELQRFACSAQELARRGSGRR